MATTINYVHVPIFTGDTPTSMEWASNSTPANALNVAGGRDPRGNPIPPGLTVGSAVDGANTALEGLEPGQTVRIWLEFANGNPVSAGLYRSRTAAITEGDHAVNLERESADSNTSYADAIVPDGEGLVWLKLQATGDYDSRLDGVRVSVVEPGAEPDGLGVFDGDTTDTEDWQFSWLGDPYASQSEALDLNAPEPEPDPGEPGEPPEDMRVFLELSKRVAAYLGKPGNTKLEALALEHVPIITAYVHGYTRGHGFDANDIPRYDLRQVIISTTARLTSNPEQLIHFSSGDYSERPAVLAGWTLPELAVLNGYRKRWA